MMPLTFAKPGETVRIKNILGKTEVRQHLAELGFVKNEEITVISSVGGNTIIQVKEGRVALGNEMASKIMI